MPDPAPTDRYDIEAGYVLSVEVPAEDAASLREALTRAIGLAYGDYDGVAFESAAGTQYYRSLGTGRNAPTEAVVAVPCVNLRVFVPADAVEAAMRAVYADHPYEEVVALLTPSFRGLHRRGLDEDNPRRFWNRPAADWVAPELR
ncbi:hypothetical protein [Wenxinia marina]|uniref:Uncharacterized protein n=1 Tax=Wenxinia marina DSM 24838 TaxID=1123501 RepID=A0A0D0Q967_9RHOB|nr:hypothetical protein [Wenxinia marina]KIQ67613.1 hypothetical protein Wenmar_04040 [Wenxinia marina DSM 24838]GGL68048.1 hypothetical protein GCM10011392_23180 [Wenxinia marina]